MRSFLLMGMLVSASLANAAERLPESARQSLQMTIYSQDTALIEDQRSVLLKKGRNDLSIEGISPQIRPESIILDGLPLIETRFVNNPLSLDKLYEAYIGKELVYIQTNPQTGEEKEQRATILAVVGGTPILKIGDRIETNAPGRLLIPDLPEGFRPFPQLLAAIQAEKEGEFPIRLTYLSRGFSWNADYVAVLNADDKNMALNAYASVQNNSGMNVHHVALRLVAGQVNSGIPLPFIQRDQVAINAAAPKIAEQPAADLHLYSLPEPVDLEAGELKQLALLSSVSVPVEKTYHFDDVSGIAYGVTENMADHLVHARLSLRFVNEDKGGLGKPLPAGTIRVYNQDKNGALFLGEAPMADLPARQAASIDIGQAFDVTAKVRRTVFNRTEKSAEIGTEITFSNEKDQPVSVILTEHKNGTWQFIEESEKHQDPDAATVQWRITIPQHSDQKLTYRVRVDNP